MKRFILFVLLLLTCAAALAQNEKYEQRYNLLVSKLGPAGVGVETVLDNWAQADSTDAGMLMGRFNFYFTKAQSMQVVIKPSDRYLGMEPILTVKDSTGADIHYYQEMSYDDELYGMAIQAADKLVSFYPDRLDFRFLKANAYIAYEKESPDMATAYLMSLIDEDSRNAVQWIYEEQKVEDSFFADAMLEYCFSFYSIGSPSALDAFHKISLKMYELNPDNPAYLNNIGTYYLIAKQDYKTALKHYNKVLKTWPEDYTAIKNCVLLSRKQKNLKQEKKYLHMLVKYGPEKEKIVAEARLKQIVK